MPWLLVALVIALALANGANDNFKGVATLFGSGTAGYRRTLAWATACTLAGSLLAAAVGSQLARTFGGQGLVAHAATADAAFPVAVAASAAAVVLSASRLGMPVSTTHALIGSLAGAGWAAAGPTFDHGHLWRAFLLPMLATPFLAIAGVGALYPLMRWSRRRLGITRRTCLCIGDRLLPVVPAGEGRFALAETGVLLSVDDARRCKERYGGMLLGIGAQRLLDTAHYVSAGAVSFARGLNDTPKIVALLAFLPAAPASLSCLLVGLSMAVGGWIAARRVAETMSRCITPMNHGQGFTANLVTSLLVIGASARGLPVSTTHVSCGSLFGLGAVTGRAHWRTIGRIVSAWLVTLPVSAAAAAWLYTGLAR